MFFDCHKNAPRYAINVLIIAKSEYGLKRWLCKCGVEEKRRI